MFRPKNDLSKFIGEKFSHLFVLGEVRHLGRRCLLCRCDCGNEKKIFSYNLSTQRSCGCFRLTRRPFKKVSPIPESKDEIYVEAAGFNGEYLVSNYGNIFSPKSGKKIFKFKINGYSISDLWIKGKRSRRRIHVLVAEAFLGPRPYKYDINHKDLNRSNNHISNLEYVTRSENVLHSFRMRRKIGGDAIMG